jgi:ATP-binding cassette, subfamily B, bacterial
VRVFLAAQVVEIARVLLFLIVAIPIMLFQDLWMSMLSLAIVPVIVTFAMIYFRQVRHIFTEVDQSEGRLTTLLQENLTGTRVVRGFARQDYEIEKFRKQNYEFSDFEYRLFSLMSHYWMLSDMLVFSQIGLVLIGGGYLALQGSISIGTWVLFFWLVRTIIWPVRHLGRVLVDTGKATVAIGRIQEILDQVPESSETSKEPLPAGAIEIRDLTFRYNGGSTVIDDLTLTIPYGETVAFLGHSGAGKSTLVNLLVRLYDYDQGSISINGQELRTIPRDTVRSSFGMVSPNRPMPPMLNAARRERGEFKKVGCGEGRRLRDMASFLFSVRGGEEQAYQLPPSRVGCYATCSSRFKDRFPTCGDRLEACPAWYPV